MNYKVAVPRIAAVLLAVSLSETGAGPLRQDAYVWQRRWTPALDDAVAANRDVFGTWHVLAAEISDHDIVAYSGADWPATQAAQHAALPVVRIEGRITAARIPRLVAEIQSVLATTPPSLRARLEIDHDCATARLADYAVFLRAVRDVLPPATALTITALPTWLGAADFAAVAEAADGLVLQVHSIDDPRLGLFDAERAAAWVAALAARTSRPFLVALPAYGARAAVTPRGRLLALSAETAAMDGQVGEEIAVPPNSVASFLAELRHDAPAGLRGVVWFRLPTEDDRRAWSIATLRAVVRGDLPAAHLEIVARPGNSAGVYDILVHNEGDSDAALPAGVMVPSSCSAADGLGQYSLDGARLALRGHGLLPAHDFLLAGWMRCDRGVEALRAQD